MVGFFIHRPIFASSIAVIMVLAGAICYFLLPVSQFPDITPPQVVVSAVYPGASAQVVADTVTTPLEQQINGVQGMTYMSSSSSNDGSSTITMTFDVGYPLSIAAVDVQNRVAQAAASLPAIVNQAGVIIKKQNPNFVLIVNLISPDRSVDPVALSNYAYLQVVDPLKRVPGSATCRYSVNGAIRCGSGSIRTSSPSSALPRSMSSRRSPNRTSRSPPARSGSRRRRKARRSRCRSARRAAQRSRAIQRISCCGRIRQSGAIVRMRDVARIELGALQYSSTAVFGQGSDRGAGGVPVAGLQRPRPAGATSRTRWTNWPSRFPKGIAYGLHYDTTRFVRAAKRDVIITLSEALGLVILVVFIFLQNWRTTLIPTIAIPVSLIATLAVMEVMGFLAEYAEPARHGAGDRPGGRRCHRGGGKRRAPARERAAAAARGAGGDGRSDGADHRHHGGADGGVRSGRVHPRRHRAAL